jgi:hypothetical protein
VHEEDIAVDMPLAAMLRGRERMTMESKCFGLGLAEPSHVIDRST